MIPPIALVIVSPDNQGPLTPLCAPLIRSIKPMPQAVLDGKGWLLRVPFPFALVGRPGYFSTFPHTQDPDNVSSPWLQFLPNLIPPSVGSPGTLSSSGIACCPWHCSSPHLLLSALLHLGNGFYALNSPPLSFCGPSLVIFNQLYIQKTASTNTCNSMSSDSCDTMIRLKISTTAKRFLVSLSSQAITDLVFFG